MGQQRFQDSQKQIATFARQVLRRAKAAGAASVELSDIESELALVWVIASEKFDPQYGVPFGAYLRRGMVQHINRWIQDQIEESFHTSLDLEIDDSYGLHDRVSSLDAGPDEIAEVASTRRLVMKNLPDQSRIFLELLETPPPEFLEIMKAAQDRAAYARSRGMNAVAPTDVTAPMVFDLLGLNRKERTEVYVDLNFWARR